MADDHRYWVLIVPDPDYEPPDPEAFEGPLLPMRGQPGHGGRYLTRRDEHDRECLVLFSSEGRALEFGKYHAEIGQDGRVATGGMPFPATASEIRTNLLWGDPTAPVLIDPGPDEAGEASTIGELE